MKAKEALELMQISRPTLSKYVKEGRIGVKVLGNGLYDYNDSDVYKFINRELKRKTVIYSRVSTPKQKADLINQEELLKSFCIKSGITVDGAYSDTASGISFEKRTNFFIMLDEIISGKIERVVVTYKDRLSRVGFDLFKHLFKKYGCEILVVSEVGSEKLDSEEIFEEIVSLLHCYSMKLYSKRRISKIKEALSDDSSS